MPSTTQLHWRIIPDDELHEIARKTMRGDLHQLRVTGRSEAQEPEEFYGFRAEDVAEIHFQKHGTGRGVWYRLKDGRVIDAIGKPSERDRSWYVAVVH
jgi:hypothetical protein